MKKWIITGLLMTSLTALAGCDSIELSLKGDDYVDAKIAASSQQKADEAKQKELNKALKADKSAFPQLSQTVAKDEAEVKITTTMGDITLKLFPKYAPLAVENFLTHAKEGYYNNLTFHRVINDFMIQAGDPNGDGSGGESIWYGKDKSKDSGTGFKNETSAYLYNIRGALAMANTGQENTNGSQFFINQQPNDQTNSLSSDTYPQPILDAYKNGGNPMLDGQYTVFGQVISGMDVVNKIAKVQVGDGDKPVDDVKIKSITILKDYSFK